MYVGGWLVGCWSVVVSHLLYLDVAGRVACHERWDVLELHGMPRVLELPRWLPDELDGTPPDGCHGAQRLWKALWFHDNGQPPTHIHTYIVYRRSLYSSIWFGSVLGYNWIEFRKPKFIVFQSISSIWENFAWSFDLFDSFSQSSQCVMIRIDWLIDRW